ncbi:molybdopterin-dependent oxidoreductase [Massilia antarctica]|uniref:molybdopterin-dependent oxidoreductase n=1 Tax=Massilia antarctica TaxID=2765360 RepID=UPI0006BB936E|nr:molybdopterin-dependent oxidoreductase [Massilia sp. H27-R4]MCY0913853.1 molybdopterin-dependent oxidoreductase [Massilia sp. H27-R4]CUI04417.1 COG2041: Sulfite oxidase and related enzymes [Janthinobacterium sp. CG23_2]CUU28203.1 COG2041: Sulfite oxidase and related enzymes [Janthinobacterium sp. CG23_2]
MKLFKSRDIVVHAEGAAMLADAVKRIAQPSRRAFLERSLTLGGLSLLTGCSTGDQDSIEQALSGISRLNDRVQGLLFDPARLAPTYPASMITRPFPFNAFYGEEEVRQIDGEAWRLELSGMVADRKPWTLARLRALPQQDQITRHICVEGWSAIGKWGGVSFGHFLRHVGADLSARYVGFQCADDYFTSIDMATALHPQTLMALTYDGQPLPPRYGFPMKLRMPTKLGYKNPKHIQAIFVTNTYPGGYWENQGYNWFGGS